MADEKGKSNFTLELCQKKYDKYPGIEQKTDENRASDYKKPSTQEDQILLEITPEGQKEGEECGNANEYKEISLGPDNKLFPGCLAGKGTISWRQKVIESEYEGVDDEITDRFIFEVELEGPEAECPCIIGKSVLIGNINFGPYYFTHISDQENKLRVEVDGKTPGSLPFPGERLAVYAEMKDPNKPEGDQLALGIDGPNCCGDPLGYTTSLEPVVANSFNSVISSKNTSWAYVCQTRFETPLFAGGVVKGFATEASGEVVNEGSCPEIPDVNWLYKIDFENVSDDSGSNEDVLIDLLNNVRRYKGLNILDRDKGLDSVAQEHANYMASIEEVTHDRPSDTSFSEQVNGSSFCEETGPVSWAENLASATEEEAPQIIHNRWVNSLEYYNNMIEPKYTHVGQGTVVGNDGKKYYCCVFGECVKKDILENGNARPLDFFGPGVGDFVLLLKAGEKHEEPFDDSVLGSENDNYRICGAQLFFDPFYYSIDDIRSVSVASNPIIKINDDASVVVDSGEVLRLDNSVKYYCEPNSNKYVYDVFTIDEIKKSFLKTKKGDNETVIHDGSHITGFSNKPKLCYQDLAVFFIGNDEVGYYYFVCDINGAKITDIKTASALSEIESDWPLTDRPDMFIQKQYVGEDGSSFDSTDPASEIQVKKYTDTDWVHNNQDSAWSRTEQWILLRPKDRAFPALWHWQYLQGAFAGLCFG